MDGWRIGTVLLSNSEIKDEVVKFFNFIKEENARLKVKVDNMELILKFNYLKGELDKINNNQIPKLDEGNIERIDEQGSEDNTESETDNKESEVV